MARLLGVDYGERRIGLAVSDPAGSMAFPVKVLEVKSDRDGVESIASACAELGAEGIVLGLPVNMDGSKGPMVDKVEAFAERLRARLGLPVSTWDERLSTGMAERVLLDADLSRARRKGVRDKLAAQIILQGYLDARSEQPPG